MGKHYKDMTREELLDLVYYLASSCLDLGQSLAFSKDLKPEYFDKAYENNTRLAYKLSNDPFNFSAGKSNVDITIFGGEELVKGSSFVENEEGDE